MNVKPAFDLISAEERNRFKDKTEGKGKRK